MNTTLNFTFLILLFALATCNVAEERHGEDSTGQALSEGLDSMRFVWVMREESTGNCGDEGSGCASISLSYPKFERNVQKETEDSLNAIILANIIGIYATEADPKLSDVEALIQQFFKDYNEFSSEFEDTRLGWMLEQEVKVYLNTPWLLSMDFSYYIFTGGAHGFGSFRYINIDPSNARNIAEADLFVEGYQKELNKLAERVFRKVRELPEGADLAEAGFNFQNDRFALNDNFLITESGIEYYFENYEIAPYSFGPTSVFLPYKQITHLLKDEWKSKLLKVS